MTTSFKPFWIETNQIFRAVNTVSEYQYLITSFKKAYPDKNILDLKISKRDFNLLTMSHREDSENLLSFGLVGEHIHDIDYTLRDYLSSYMKPLQLQIGDVIEDSPVGSGIITEFTEAGYPKVNDIAVACLKRIDRAVFGTYEQWKSRQPVTEGN